VSQIIKKFLGLNSVDEDKIRLSNDAALRARNAANTADVDLIKAANDDRVQVGQYKMPATDGSSGDVLSTNGSGNLSWISGGGGGGANTELSNLDSPTAINESLIPDNTATHSLGSDSLEWDNLYIRKIKTSDDSTVIDVQNRMLKRSSGTNVLDFENRILYDNLGLDAINFESADDLVVSKNIIPDTNPRNLGQASSDTWFYLYLRSSIRDEFDATAITIPDRTLHDNNSYVVADWGSEDNIFILKQNPNDYTPRSLRFEDSNNLGASYIDLRAPNTVTNSYTLTLPPNPGSSGQVLSTNGNGQTSWVDADNGGGGGSVGPIYRSFNIAGDLVVEGDAALPIFIPDDAVIENIFAYVRGVPDGSDIILDVLKNGSTIFTTTANRPTIEDGENASGAAEPDVTALSSGDVLELVVVQVGSNVIGRDLVVVVELSSSETNNNDENNPDIGNGLVYRSFYYGGHLYVTGELALPIFMPKDEKISAYVRDAPDGQDIILDILKNGTSIFTDPEEGLVIEDLQNSVIGVVPDVQSVSAGDVLELSALQTGSNNAGRDLVVVIETRE
jgi:hypothetical protein